MSFENLGLSAPLMRAVDALKYATPTPIQAKAIPVALAGSDLVGLAETGSGKTASYLLPILQRIAGGEGLRALVLAPTRELALQIDQVATTLAEHTGLRSVCVVGGMSMNAQIQKLRAGVDLCIATPGRLLDHVRSGEIWLDQISELVLDEADRLLDMGFLPDIRRITQRVPRSRHTMLFSATLSAEVEGLAYELLRDPKTIEIGRRARTVGTLDQVAYSVLGHHKTPLLLRLAEERIDGQALVFARTKKSCDIVARALKAHGHAVELMHADRSQQQRIAALDRFKKGKVKMLVATDLAARGIDIEDVAYVVNYDIPATVDDYVHRCGRTARAGRSGTAMTFVAPTEALTMRDFERATGAPITIETVDNFSDGRSQADAAAAFLASLHTEGSAPAARPFGRRGRR